MTSPSFPLLRSERGPRAGGVTLALTLESTIENPVVGDLHLDGGQVHLWDGANAYVQKARIRTKFWLGDWFLDRSIGFPYLEFVLGVKSPSKQAIASLFRKMLSTIPGAKAVNFVTVTINADRSGSVDWQVTFDDGAIISSADFGPFRITP